MVRSSDFSHYELISILEVIEASRACGTYDDLRCALARVRDIVDADYAISGVCSMAGGEVAGVEAAVNAGYPDEFVELYISERYFQSDPVVRYLSKFSFTQSWAEIFDKTVDVASAPVRHVMGTACDFGLRHGVSTGVYVPGNNQLNVISFAGPGDRFHGHQKKVLDVLVLHLNKAMARIAGGPGPCDTSGPADNRLQGHD